MATLPVTRLRIYGDSLAYSQGRRSEGTGVPDPLTAMVYTIGHALGLADADIENLGVSGSKIADALARQKATPAGPVGSLDILWTGHNDLRNRVSYQVIQNIKDGYVTFYNYARANGGDALILGPVTGFGFGEGSQGFDDVADLSSFVTGTFPAADCFYSWEYLSGQIGADAVATSQVLIDAGLLPTTVDSSDIVSGWHPDSIRADNGVGHLNQLGYDTYGARLASHILTVSPPDPPPPPDPSMGGFMQFFYSAAS